METATTTIMFTIVYRNSLHRTAIINSEQAVSQVTNTIEIYAQEMKNDLKMVEKEIQWVASPEELRDYLNHMVQINSGCVSVMIYDEEGNILEYGADEGYIMEKQTEDISFLPDLFSEAEYEISFYKKQTAVHPARVCNAFHTAAHYGVGGCRNRHCQRHGRIQQYYRHFIWGKSVRSR